jgi:sec-independent protein translocase protein TatB
MFDIGFSELLLVALVALVVLGPEKLPHAARLTGAMLGKLRRSFYDLKWQVEQEIEENEYKKRVEEQLKQTEQMVNESLAPETMNQSLDTAQQAAEHHSEHHSSEHHTPEHHLPEPVSIETNNHPSQSIETTQVHEHEHRPHSSPPQP